MVKLKDFNIGHDDGEQEAADSVFVDLFYTDNDSYNSILDKDKFIIKGKKGTGKTLLAEYVKTKHNKKNQMCEIFKMTDIHEQMIKDSNVNMKNEEFKMFQRWFFTLVIGKSFVKKEGYRGIFNGKIRKFKKEIKALYPENAYFLKNFQKKYQGNGAIERAVKDTKISLGAMMAIEQEFTKNNYCNQVDKFFNLIKSMCKRKDVIIFIDDIDDFRGSIYENENYINFLISLIDVIKRFNMDMRKSSINCKIVLLMRDDILEVLHSFAANSNKISSSIIELNWVKNYQNETKYDTPLVSMVLYKLKNSVPEYRNMENKEVYDILFSKFDNENMKSFSDYMMFNGCGRPREVIKLLNLVKNKFPDKESFRLECFRKVSADYSLWFMDEIKNEMTLKLSNYYILDVFNLLKNFGKTSFFKGEIETFFKENEGEYPYIKDISVCLTYLYEYNVLGNMYISKNRKKYSWHYYRFAKKVNLKQKFIVHGALRKSLKLQ